MSFMKEAKHHSILHLTPNLGPSQMAKIISDISAYCKKETTVWEKEHMGEEANISVLLVLSFMEN